MSFVFSNITLIFTAALVILQTKGVRSLQIAQCKGTIANVQYEVRFLLYTDQNPHLPQEIFLDDVESLNNSSFDPSLPTRFVTHGWRESSASDSCVSVTNGYLHNGEYNVIVVDWSKLAEIDYPFARYSVDAVGLVVARFLEFLESDGDTSLQDVYLVGFSLGAHVFGFAGKFVDSPIAAIVGLDPALPLFYFKSTKCRLADTDADYVLVIHSASYTFGFAASIGVADFYINYGYALTNQRCSHNVAYQLFANSLYPQYEYWGLSCRSSFEVTVFRVCTGYRYYAIMGEDPIDTGVKGVFNVVWNSTSPTRENLVTNPKQMEIEALSKVMLNETCFNLDGIKLNRP